MEEIKHNFIEVNGLKLHVAEAGNGSSKVVLFLHGFPEIWYSWRYQMIALAKAGYRAIAPDFRGYGLSDSASQPENTTFTDYVSDIAALLDSLAISKVFAVGKDFGAWVAYDLALVHPGKVIGVVTLGVPYMPPGPPTPDDSLPEGFYITRFGELGRAEADFARMDAKTVVRNVYILFSRSEVPIAAKTQEIMDMVDPLTPLPSWFTEEDLAAYGALYDKSGFQTALRVPYRAFDTRPVVEEPKVEVPALYIQGEKDYLLNFPGVEDYIRGGEVKKFVPNLEIIYLPEGTHFVQEQSPEQINQLLLDFLSTHA